MKVNETKARSGPFLRTGHSSRVRVGGLGLLELRMKELACLCGLCAQHTLKLPCVPVPSMGPLDSLSTCFLAPSSFPGPRLTPIPSSSSKQGRDPIAEAIGQNCCRALRRWGWCHDSQYSQYPPLQNLHPYFTNEESKMCHVPRGQPGLLAVGSHNYTNRYSRPLLLAGSLGPPDLPCLS